MDCPACGGPLLEGAAICPRCGTKPSASPEVFGTLVSATPARRGAPSLAGPAALGGRYQIRAILGEGPLATVYRAFDREIEVEVAVKVLRKSLFQRDEYRESFLAGCAEARRLAHANLVRLYHADAKGAYPFFAMQLVEGLTLRRILVARKEQSQRFSVGEVEPILSQMVAALEHLYQAVPAHGLVKPENVLLLPDLLKVTDFHLTSSLALPLLLVAEARAGASVYVAPEVRAGGPLSPAADVYSLGVLTVELLTGVVPQDTGVHLRARHPELPPSLDALWPRCLTPDPKARIPRPGGMLAELRALLTGRMAPRPVPAPPPQAVAPPTNPILDTSPVRFAETQASPATPSPTAPSIVTAVRRPREGRGVPLAVWILLILAALTGATFAIIRYIDAVREQDRLSLLLQNERERQRLEQERRELLKLRADLDAKERDATKAAEEAKRQAETALKEAGGDPKKRAEAERLAAIARKKEARRAALRRRLKELERREAERVAREREVAKAEAEKRPVDPLPPKGAEPSGVLVAQEGKVRPPGPSPREPEERATGQPAAPPTVEVPPAVQPAAEAPVAPVAPAPAPAMPPEPVPAPAAPPPAAPEATAPTTPAPPTPQPPAPPAEEETRPKTIFLREDMPQPVRVEGQMPVYTQAARERGIEGTVVVLFKVTPSGATSDVRIIKDLPLLGEICSVAVRRWRFRPVVHEGRPVTVVMKQAFVFRLSE